MRVLFTTPPLYGHFHPLVPYAQALQDAGHDVAFAVAGDFCTVVESSGFRCFQAGSFDSSVQTRAVERVTREGKTAATVPPSLTIFRELFIEKPAPAMAKDLTSLFDSWRPDVIVRDVREFGGAIAAEFAGIPHVTAGAGVFRSPEWWNEVTAEPLNQLRVEHDLPRDPQMSMLFRYLDLVSMPPALIRESDYVASTAHFVQPVSFDQSGDEQLPDWFGELPNRPIVYGTLGTTNFTRIPGAFEAMAEAMVGTPYTGILTVGRSRDPSEVDPHAENVRVERYIPQSVLMPHCAAVVCHGGFSSMMASLLHGLPLVVIPLGADQFENAERAVEIGAAEVVPPPERTPERIREAIRTVLIDPSYRQNAERFRDDVKVLPGLGYAVELLERLSRERKPILREESGDLEAQTQT